MYDVEVSTPTGAFIYVSASGNASRSQQLGVFKRDVGSDLWGAATVTQGTLTNLKFPCSDPDGDAVTRTQSSTRRRSADSGRLDEPNDRVGYAASQGQCGTTSFTFRATLERPDIAEPRRSR